jgi:hypothetical protein
VTYDRGIESGAKRKQVGSARRGTHNACGSRRNRKRTGRIELLPADFAVYGGREPRREFDFSCGREAVSACRLDSFIAYGFYQSWRAKKCQRRPNMIASALLWVSAIFVVISIFFPQVMANAAAGLLAR